MGKRQFCAHDCLQEATLSAAGEARQSGTSLKQQRGSLLLLLLFFCPILVMRVQLLLLPPAEEEWRCMQKTNAKVRPRENLFSCLLERAAKAAVASVKQTRSSKKEPGTPPTIFETGPSVGLNRALHVTKVQCNINVTTMLITLTVYPTVNNKMFSGGKKESESLWEVFKSHALSPPPFFFACFILPED